MSSGGEGSASVKIAFFITNNPKEFINAVFCVWPTTSACDSTQQRCSYYQVVYSQILVDMLATRETRSYDYPCHLMVRDGGGDDGDDGDDDNDGFCHAHLRLI